MCGGVKKEGAGREGGRDGRGKGGERGREEG